MIAAIKKQIRMLKRESKIKRGVEQLIEAGGKPYDDPIVATLHDVLADIIIRQKIALENTLFTSEKRDEYLKLVKEEELINLKIQKELSRVLKEHTANASVAAIVGLPPDEETELDGDMTDLMDMITRMSGGARRRTRRHRKTQRRH
ncbi:hypothetical protein EBZ80_22680 [bacterium]|nr:hypothetical protein [bacterium]